MRYLTSGFLIIALFLVSACSETPNSSASSGSSNTVTGVVGAGHIDSVQVIANQLSGGGQLGRDTTGLYTGSRNTSDAAGRFSVNTVAGESFAFIARGQVANADKNIPATQERCLQKLGCGALANFGGSFLRTPGTEWSAVVYSPLNDSRVNVNIITTLAAKLSYRYAYNSLASGPSVENNSYTPYDIVQANSHVADLFALEDLMATVPANLANLNALNADDANLAMPIRYGALLAAFQKKQLEYDLNPIDVNKSFLELLVEQFLNTNGQLENKAAAPVGLINMESLYQLAANNLGQVLLDSSINTAISDVAVNVQSQLVDAAAAAAAPSSPVSTAAQAAPLQELLGTDLHAKFEDSLAEAKTLVASLLAHQQDENFWSSGYHAVLAAYTGKLKGIHTSHEVDIKALVKEFVDIQGYYLGCVTVGCDVTSADKSQGLLPKSYDVAYNPATKQLTLTLNGNAIEVSQRLADLNLTDNITQPSASHAVDVLMTGTLVENGVTLKSSHKLGANGDIEVPSALRVYYEQEVNTLVASVIDVSEIGGKEIIWGQFELYDVAAIGNANTLDNEMELEGALRLFYRGVDDPKKQDERRFNLEEMLLLATISDKVHDSDSHVDTNTTTLNLSAKSENAAVYYPDAASPVGLLPSFASFFTPSTVYSIDHTEPALLSYDVSTETISQGVGSVDVQVIDFIYNLDGIDDVRYRFYPTKQIVDKLDFDRDGDTTEFVGVHDIEECILVNNTTSVSSCSPKSRLYQARDLQKTINDLWELGHFQRLLVPGQGTYYLNFPTAADSNGCQVLAPLNTGGSSSVEGVLVENTVLGLKVTNLRAEIELQGQPLTLLNINLAAPSTQRYSLISALSHAYSASATVGGVTIGVGNEANSLLLNHDGSGSFHQSGSVALTKKGVSLTALMDQPFTQSNNGVRYDPVVETVQGGVDVCISPTPGSLGAQVAAGFSGINNPIAGQTLQLNHQGVVSGSVLPAANAGEWLIQYIDGSTRTNTGRNPNPSDNITSPWLLDGVDAPWKIIETPWIMLP